MKMYFKLIAFFAVLLLHSAQVLSQSMTLSYPSSHSFVVSTPITTITPTVTGGTPAPGQTTMTFAGSGSAGSMNGTGTSANFRGPLNTAVDKFGNVYVADSDNDLVRKISPLGVVTTFAGSGMEGATDGFGVTASFRHPSALVVDGSGNVYVSDQQNHKIRKITPAGQVTTLAGTGVAGSSDGTGTAASFSSPIGLAIDPGLNLYVADYGNSKIRKINLLTSVVTTYAGTGAQGATNGAALSATFKNPMGLAIDGAGNMFVADRMNYMVRKITQAGVVSTYAGSGSAGSANGLGTAASFNRPNAVATDPFGNVYVADDQNHVIRKITSSGGQGLVTTFAGLVATTGLVNGTGSVVRFNAPYGLCVDSRSNIYVAENFNHTIRKIITKEYDIVPQLPDGLYFNNATGTISGTPNVVSPATDYKITAYNATTTSNTVTVNISVTATPVSSIFPSQDQNYIISYIPRTELLTPAAVAMAASDKEKVQATIQYFDPLNRPLQRVVVNGNGDGSKDLIQPIAYDPLGLEPIKYQAYTSGSGNAGNYRSNALIGSGGYSNSAQKNFYALSGMGYKDTQTPYAVTLFENSPLNRAIELGNTGDLWQPVLNSPSGHTQKIDYSSNNTSTNYANDGFAVRFYTATPVTTVGQEYKRRISGTAYYAANDLSLTIKKDENWKSSDAKNGTVEEYKDPQGKIILKRSFTGTSVLSTYYVYDDLGNLCFVLPPGANADTGLPSQAILDNFCYQYRYDGSKRLIEQRIPGRGWDHMVYDKLDQLVMSQDSVQRGSNKWLFVKYDALGRSIITGIANSSATRITWQNSINSSAAKWEKRDDLNSSGTGTGYSNLTLPASGLVQYYYTINYYDDYAFLGNVFGLPVSGQNTYVKGFLTGKKENVLGTNSMLLNVNYYDSEGRVVQNKSHNYKGGTVDNTNYDIINNTYNFSSELIGSVRKHYIGNVEKLYISSDYVYDHMGRKKDVWQNIATTQVAASSNSPVLLSRFVYNELGDLASKNLHSTNNGASFIQKNEYSYNERGWITKINDPDNVTSEKVLGMELTYGNKADAYNGNIGAINWQIKVPSGLGIVQQKQSYTYDYDKLNRLEKAKYTTAGLVDKFNEEMSYDGMGNILALKRKNSVTGFLNNFTYNYLTGGINTNKLSGVSDAGTASQSSNYTYDGNGNQKTDSRKDIEMTYNYLNLPQSVIKASTGESINFVYDASGRKLRKVVGSNSRDYIQGIEYNNGIIDFVLTEQGRALPGTAFTYEYMIKDHLGNTRATVKQNGDIVQVQDYYAFGMEMPNVNTVSPSPPNQYKYNGKEKQVELGLDQLDYVNRFYDPLIGRFNSVDKLSTSFPHKSPYDYAENRPVNGVDLDGLEWVSTIDAKGSTHISVNTRFDFTVDPKLLPTGTSVADYQRAISSAFNDILNKASGGKISGSVGFTGLTSEESRRIVPFLTLEDGRPESDASIYATGATVASSSWVSLYNKLGEFRSLYDVARDGVHELFHTLRLDHPFGKTLTNDTKLISLNATTFETTSETDPNISYNLMNYGSITIDGEKLRDLWKDGRHDSLTPGQIEFILNEIQLQMSGAGISNNVDYYMKVIGEALKLK